MKATYPNVSLERLVAKVLTCDPKTARAGEEFDYIDISSVSRETKQVEGHNRIAANEAPSRARQIVRAGDVLVSTVRPNLNAVAQVPVEFDGAIASTGFTVLRPKSEALDGGYLFHWVKTPHFVAEMVKQATGASYPAVSDRIVKESLIPLPPMVEQRHIAALLDKADAVRAKRRQALAQLDTLLQAVFLEMFGDPVTNPKGWEKRCVGEISCRITKGESPKWQGFGYEEKGVRFVTSENVGWGRMLIKEDKFISSEFHQKLKRSQVAEDDIFINLVGASIGRTAIAHKELLPANVNQAVAVITLNKEIVLPSFILLQLLSPQIQRKLLGEIVDAARANISLANVRELELIIPPFEAQTAFRRFEQKFADCLARQSKGLDEANCLFQSLQQRTFAGELFTESAADLAHTVATARRLAESVPSPDAAQPFAALPSVAPPAAQARLFE